VAKPVKSSFFATKTPEIGGAGVKNHQLEMKSTPPQFFARADFDPAGLFWGQLTAVSAADAMAKPHQKHLKNALCCVKRPLSESGCWAPRSALVGLKSASKVGQRLLPKAASAPKTYENPHFHRFWG
jgi:hypothetical protein